MSLRRALRVQKMRALLLVAPLLLFVLLSFLLPIGDMLLRSIENEADRLMLELYREIYSGKLDSLQMFLLKEFFEILEKAIDRCREAGVVAYQIVLKNS